MDILSIITTPTVLLFLVIVIGYCIGKIKVYDISMDLSAILIVAILAGLIIKQIFEVNLPESFEHCMSTLSETGTALFVASISISTGYSASRTFNKNSILYIILGMLMVFVAFITAQIIYIFDYSIDKSVLLGILCGAMTSTPGLSSVCNIKTASSDAAVFGYGCTYMFGVIGAVTFVQFITSKLKPVTPHEISKSYDKQTRRPVDISTLIQIGIAVVIGYLLGSIELPGIKFSIGNSGGILCSGILVGHIVNKYCGTNQNNTLSLDIYRNLGLVMFFVGTGVPAGCKLTEAFHIKWFIYGILITLIPILFAFIYCRVFLQKNSKETAAIIAGGMTSTPAIAVLLKNKKIDTDLSAYSITYVGALLTMVLGVYIV